MAVSYERGTRGMAVSYERGTPVEQEETEEDADEAFFT